ncbi:hypothetical protein PAT3040_02581 [Paenibacillus agaridevorans]|uniref:Uncharacterized protein n=1 Tax=Paenibacillus agaridevorans TaxID=171404 RepID=A0A2R5EXC3_9BACL|nr:hypothetical protein [Paenibacillus agaridevorans]GBG08014.1 hypothetical protein PAT3040_02581 [Paenibacillus agaridevorans]
MKNKVWKLAGAAVVVSAGVWAGMVVGNPLAANSNAVTPGTIEDPVVTKSYVDEQIAKLLNGGTEGDGSGNNNGGTGGSGSNGSESASNGNAVVKLEVVELSMGKTLIAAAGTEVVVRVGKAIAYSSDTNGISDLTGGVDIKNGKDVPTNHLIWFPRDGRGIKGHPDEIVPLTLIVKGIYTIK